MSLLHSLDLAWYVSNEANSFTTFLVQKNFLHSILIADNGKAVMFWYSYYQLSNTSPKHPDVPDWSFMI